MYKLFFIILLMVVCFYADAQQITSRNNAALSTDLFANKIVEIDPYTPKESKSLWKLDANGEATSLYEEKKTKWRIKDNVLYIGRKKYPLEETAFMIIE